MASLLKNLREFRSNERGNIALLFGLSLVPMVGAAGVAVDYGVASNMKTSLQAEVDATALDIAKAAVDIHIDAANKTKTQAERQALVDTKVTQIMAARTAIAQARATSGSNFTFTGAWADDLKTAYNVAAHVDVNRNVRLLSSQPTTGVTATATAAMKYDAVLKSSKPEMLRPGFNAGDYNRLYAYCFNKNETDASKRRTKETAVTSNGSNGSGAEVDTNEIFSNVVMPECDVDKGETLSWRLLNVRNARTDSSRWPKDTKTTTTTGKGKGKVTETTWTSADPTGENTSTDPKKRTLYNHYSDTLVNPTTGLESYQFTGDQMGYYAPINIMETVVCSTKELCNPDTAGSIVPKGDNRTPTPASTKCEAGKFMFIGFEDRPYVPGRLASEYSTWGSGYWTDRDYEDVTFVVSCPSKEITGYTQKIWLTK
jgi:Flp pilus assembly protein TadG